MTIKNSSTFGSFAIAGCSHASFCSTFATMLRCKQRRALRHAGRAAGVLQERDVLRRDRARVERLALAGRERRLEGRRLRQRIGRHHLLHLSHDQIDDRALREAEQVAHRGDDDVLHARVLDDLLERGGEVLQDDDRLGARVVELMLELARRIERIDVHHRHAGAQHAGGRDRVLQHVRHHDGDAVAELQARALQVGGEVARHGVEVAIGDRLVHADEGVAVAELREALLQQHDQRGILRRVDLGRHPRRIALQPDAIHCGLPSPATVWRRYGPLCRLL